MIRYLTAITAAVILSTGAAAQSIQLKSLPAGSNLTFVAQASSEIPNDLAVMVFRLFLRVRIFLRLSQI